MGFIQAMYDLGALDIGQGLEPYLKLPVEKEGKLFKVYLDIEDTEAEVLKVLGVNKIDLADLDRSMAMKVKYLYRDRVGANVSWGFTPLYKLGKPKGSIEKNREDWVGPSGNWEQETGSHLSKIKNRVLLDYERLGVLSPGSVDIIMQEIQKEFEDNILISLQNKESHMVIFGAVRDGEFIYPGEIPAFVSYFKNKLQQSLQGQARKSSKLCSICGQRTSDFSTLTSVFKFATVDKVSFLPGLDKNQHQNIFITCRECLERVSAGRERVERTLTNTGVVPGVRMWIVPEAVGVGSGITVRPIVQKLEQHWKQEGLKTPGEAYESRQFTQLAKEGYGLVFHFLFWEKNNAQELVHLMVEDVPPERLAFLERKWGQAMCAVSGKVENGLNLDWAISSLYATLSRFAGKSDSDKMVFRDLAMKILGKMLRAETLPILTFKKMIISRATRLVYENDNWEDVKKSLRYAQIWAEYMVLINQGVSE